MNGEVVGQFGGSCRGRPFVGPSARCGSSHSRASRVTRQPNWPTTNSEGESLAALPPVGNQPAAYKPSSVPRSQSRGDDHPSWPDVATGLLRPTFPAPVFSELKTALEGRLVPARCGGRGRLALLHAEIAAFHVTPPPDGARLLVSVALIRHPLGVRHLRCQTPIRQAPRLSGCAAPRARTFLPRACCPSSEEQAASGAAVPQPPADPDRILPGFLHIRRLLDLPVA